MSKEKFTEDELRKVTFVIPEKVYEDLAFFTASLPGAPTPGPYMKTRAFIEAEKGTKLRRERVATKGK